MDSYINQPPLYKTVNLYLSRSQFAKISNELTPQFWIFVHSKGISKTLTSQNMHEINILD